MLLEVIDVEDSHQPTPRRHRKKKIKDKSPAGTEDQDSSNLNCITSPAHFLEALTDPEKSDKAEKKHKKKKKDRDALR
jgi:hypothetical protein